MRNYVIALYIRLSVEDFKTESLSIPNQKLILREKAMSLPEWDDSEILEFIDNGHTGTNFERPAVQELLTMVQAGKINCIIVKDLSRFGRNSIETGYFIERVFPLYHTRFISVSDDFDTANFKGDTGGIDIAFKYLISEWYSRDMSMKTKSAKYAKMRRGEYQSVICPYGYRKSADGRMEPDEDVAPNVQMIFQWASEGNTAAEITRKLYAMNIPTPGEYRKLKGKAYYNVSRTNGVWSTSTVLRILEDQRYIGTYVIGKRKVKEIGSRHTQLKDESEWFKIPNHHPAIVSVDLFERANASIKRFSLSNKKPRDYLLRGKVFCGCCDHAMSLRNGAWFYCRHSEVAETLPCHGVRIKMADLEQVVFETIRAQMCPALGIDSNKDKLDLQTVQQAEHEEKLRSIQDSKRYLYEQYALGEIDLETYRTRKAVYDTELVQAKNVHAVITAQTKQIKSDYEIKLKQQEIVQEVGAENAFIFGLSSEEVINYENNGGYNPTDIYFNDWELKRVIDQLMDGTYANGDHEMYKNLYNSLLNTQCTDRADTYFILKDFRSYAEAQKRVEEAYRDQQRWSRMAMMNTICSGKFSSDRTIEEYVSDIWKLEKVDVAPLEE